MFIQDIIDKYFKKIIILIVIFCLGIVVWTGYQITSGEITKDEAFGISEDTTYNYSFINGRIMPQSILKEEDKNKECIDCHLNESGFPLKEWVIEKYNK